MVDRELFKDVKVNATLGQIHEASIKLTNIEFRTWVSKCEVFGSFDVSHFQGMEADFLSTGKWRFSGERDFEFVK
jgi:hypothetical protein